VFDSIPTLDLTLAVLLAVLIARFAALLRIPRTVDEFSQQIIHRLKRQPLEDVLEYADGEVVPIQATLIGGLLETAARSSGEDATQLREKLEADWTRLRRRQVRRLQSARARDLVGIALILGAGVYAHGSLDADAAFYALGGGILLLLCAGMMVRRLPLATSDATKESILAAITSAAIEHRGGLECAQCGSTMNPVTHPRLTAEGSDFDVVELWHCSACGVLAGRTC
jgi:hypothetical protein